MKYISVEWPDIQEYMFRPDFREESYYDPIKDTWFIPENWENENYLEEPELGTKEFFDIYDCWDAIGGDWYG